MINLCQKDFKKKHKLRNILENEWENDVIRSQSRKNVNGSITGLIESLSALA